MLLIILLQALAYWQVINMSSQTSVPKIVDIVQTPRPVKRLKDTFNIIHLVWIVPLVCVIASFLIAIGIFYFDVVAGSLGIIIAIGLVAFICLLDCEV